MLTQFLTLVGGFGRSLLHCCILFTDYRFGILLHTNEIVGLGDSVWEGIHRVPIEIVLKIIMDVHRIHHCIHRDAVGDVHFGDNSFEFLHEVAKALP